MHSTIYDKDLKQRVFQVRDSERYTNSTQTSLSVTTNNNNREYIVFNLTATVLNNEGTSSIAFYDNDTLLGTVDCIQGTTPDTLTAYVPYGEHKLYAKYLGNSQCLSSKSPIKLINIDEPNLKRTGFTGADVTNFFLDSTGNIEVYLWDKSADPFLTPIGNKTVKLYVDGEYHSSATTNNSGVGSSAGKAQLPLLSQSLTLDTGIHECLIVFDGDDTYFGVEMDAVITVWESEDILDVAPRFAKIGTGDTAIFDVNYHQYDDTPIASQTLELKRGNTVRDTQVTDTDGLAVLTELIPSADEGTVEYDIRDGSLYDELLGTTSIEAVKVDKIALEYDEVTIDGLASPIKSTIYKNNTPVSGILVHIDNVEYVTDSKGTVTHYYQATGAGFKTIDVSCGSFSRLAAFEDAIMYYNKSKDKNYDLNYSVENSLSVIETSIGLRLASSIEDRPAFYLNYPNPASEWSFSFDIKSIVSGTQIIFNKIPMSGLSSNLNITIQKTSDNKISVYKDKTLFRTVSMSSSVPYPHLQVDGTVTIDNLILTERLMRS